ncbi:hypothetical protein J437_LFUL004586, partial [Ladona fulva]
VNDAAQFAERVILGDPSSENSIENGKEPKTLTRRKGQLHYPFSVMLILVQSRHGIVSRITLPHEYCADSSGTSSFFTFFVNNGVYISVAEELWEEVKVLCWVMTKPENHATKAMAVKETWGRRCNSLFFMSSKAGEMGSTWKREPRCSFISKRHEAYFSLPAVPLNVPEGRNNLWSKTRAAFSYLSAKGYLDDKVDWVLKADDDTFVVMENLRYFLTQYNHEETIYVGLHFKKYLKQGFMSGGTGEKILERGGNLSSLSNLVFENKPRYVLSRAAAKRFVTEALPGNNSCRNTTQRFEDVEMDR